MEELLHSIFLKSPRNLWDTFEEECQKFYEQPAHSLTEMRTRDNKKIRGDIFEEFCVVYLKNVGKYDQAWRLPDVPDDVLAKLNLPKRDTGIDIIAEKGGVYSAVQCKYKKHVSTKKNILTWKTLSTFYAMCMRTGPYQKYIVMTNCSYIRGIGKKTDKDQSICLKTLQNITKEQWTSMCALHEHRMDATPQPKSIEELRAARLAFFAKPPSSS
jgi:predicted helicase